MGLQGIKLITFDATNTLLKFRMPPWQYYTLIAQDHGFRGTEDEVKIKLNSNIKDMWTRYPNYGKSTIKWENWWTQVVKMTLRDHVPTADLDSIASKLINEFKTEKCWCVADTGNKLLQQIKKLNISVGVISNFDPRLTEILQNVYLYEYFDFILTSYDVGYSKPDKQIFQSAIEMSKRHLQPSESLHIGDDLEKDYHGAKAAGWHALLVNPSLKTEKTASPHHVFNSLKELCLAIEQHQLKL